MIVMAILSSELLLLPFDVPVTGAMIYRFYLIVLANYVLAMCVLALNDVRGKKKVLVHDSVHIQTIMYIPLSGFS